MKKIVIIEMVSILLIILFMYAAVSKLVDVEKFRVQLGQSPMLTAFAGIVAWVVPLTEIAISLMLAVPWLRLFGLYCSFCLMVMFTAYIVAITQFSDYIPCSCGGILQKMGWTEHLVFNLAFVLLSLIAILLFSKKERENKNTVIA